VAAPLRSKKFKLCWVPSRTEDSSLCVTDEVIPAMPEGPNTVAQLRSAAPPDTLGANREPLKGANRESMGKILKPKIVGDFYGGPNYKVGRQWGADRKSVYRRCI